MLFSQSTSQSSPDRRPAWLKWFYNLPIGRKQLMALIACELVPILGLGVGSTIVLTNSLRAQLEAQAKSEVAVTEANYNIKVNQMGFGARGQSDNVAIIEAAKNFQRNENLPNELQDQVKQILQNEVKARKIEYATLVGKNAQIIVNANAKRSKETISGDLGNLIQQTIKENRQIKASQIVSSDELRKEAPPLPDGFDQQDALIRYVVTPVRDPANQEVTGALIFGDLVNRKPAIVDNTIKTFGTGYSAVYLRRPVGEFGLATSIEKSGTDNRPPRLDVALSDPAILRAAVAAKGETVTQRLQIGQHAYTIAAKAIPNQIIETNDGSFSGANDNPTALLVRGTSEDNLNALLASSLRQEAIVLLLSLGVIVGWSLLFRRMVLKPIEQLKQATEAFSTGDRTARASVVAEDEVGQLAIAFNQMAENIAASESVLSAEALRQERQAKEARALSEITVRMRRSDHSDRILQTAIDEIREFLKLDRVIVYKFNHNSLDATIIAESIRQNELSIIGKTISSPLGLEQIEQYHQQDSWSLNDVDRDSINDHYRQNLANLNVNAEIVAPLKRNDRFVGLLCVQQCGRPRQWEDSEVNFLTQLAVQIGYALDQAQLLQERQDALQDSETLKDSLQQQIIQLLGEVQGASRGDLTVRAAVTPGDIGTVADFFNAIVESLRQIVVKVKQSAIQVNQLLSENEGAVEQLAAEARLQAHDTTRTLESVEQMTQALQAVSDRAQQAATVAQTASSAAESGESVMDFTVTSIYSLRATIEDATKKVKQLGESSQQIGRIVSLINDLAVQTDLLAINASIEASRAGEHGRGFGIVASEIGDLASRSAAATREIESMIETIQQQTHEVVEVMNQSAVQVVEGAHSARNAKQNLVYMVQVSRQIDQFVQSISDMIIAQAETSRSMSSLMQNIAQVSSRTSTSSRQVSDALRQTVNVAEELKASVGMFKVQEGSSG